MSVFVCVRCALWYVLLCTERYPPHLKPVVSIESTRSDFARMFVDSTVICEPTCTCPPPPKFHCCPPLPPPSSLLVTVITAVKV